MRRTSLFHPLVAFILILLVSFTGGVAGAALVVSGHTPITWQRVGPMGPPGPPGPPGPALVVSARSGLTQAPSAGPSSCFDDRVWPFACPLPPYPYPGGSPSQPLPSAGATPSP